MILAFIFFLILVVIFLHYSTKAVVRYAEQREYEKKRFMLMVAEELDRMDKAIKEKEKTSSEEFIQPYKNLWQMRN